MVHHGFFLRPLLLEKPVPSYFIALYLISRNNLLNFAYISALHNFYIILFVFSLHTPINPSPHSIRNIPFVLSICDTRYSKGCWIRQHLSCSIQNLWSKNSSISSALQHLYLPNKYLRHNLVSNQIQIIIHQLVYSQLSRNWWSMSTDNVIKHQLLTIKQLPVALIGFWQANMAPDLITILV